jgi:hypothetical protein
MVGVPTVIIVSKSLLSTPLLSQLHTPKEFEALYRVHINVTRMMNST